MLKPLGITPRRVGNARKYDTKYGTFTEVRAWPMQPVPDDAHPAWGTTHASACAFVGGDEAVPRLQPHTPERHVRAPSLPLLRLSRERLGPSRTSTASAKTRSRCRD